MMATSVTSLPPNGNPTTVPSLTQEQDALISDVLQEMEKEMSSTTSVVRSHVPPQSAASSAPPSAPPMHAYAPPPPPPQRPIPGPPKSKYAALWSLPTLQKAVAAAALAYLVLHPQVSGFLMERVPSLNAFSQYEWMLRIALLVAVFYFTMLYLKL